MVSRESSGATESPCSIPADIRALLWARIAALDVTIPYADATDLTGEVEAIRRIAHAHGLNPAVTVTHFIDRALAHAQVTPPIHGWLAMLTDAVACERQDYETADRFAAACSMRLAS